MEERLCEFLEKLSALTREYGIVINGCGCCGSPWLEDMSNIKRENILLDYLTFDKNTGLYH